MKNLFFKILLLTFMMTCIIAIVRVDAAKVSTCSLSGVKEKKYTMKKSGKYEYHVVDDEIHLTAIKKVGKIVRIPETIKGKKVVAIEQATDGKSNNDFFSKVKKADSEIEKIIISNSVKAIGEAAFADSSVSFRKVVCGKKSQLKSIGWLAFSDCYFLKKFIFPKSLRSIGGAAFSDTKLRGDLLLPSKLQFIGSGAFLKTKITKVKIPKKVTSINSSTFTKCKRLEKVVLHDNITKIDDGAFQNCESLNEIEIPKSLEEFGLYAFYRTGIKKVILGEKVKIINGLLFSHDAGYEVLINKNNPYFKMIDGVLYNGKMTKLLKNFNKTNTGKFILPDTVKKFERSAFSCGAYSEIYLGDNIEELSTTIFFLHNTKIYVGKNVRQILDVNLRSSRDSEYVVSEENPYFKTVDGVLFNKEMTVLLGFPHTTKKTSYTVPEGVKTIARGAFFVKGKTTIEEIRLNSDLITIESFNLQIKNKKNEKIHVYTGDKIENFEYVPIPYIYWHVPDNSKIMREVIKMGLFYEIVKPEIV